MSMSKKEREIIQNNARKTYEKNFKMEKFKERMINYVNSEFKF